MSVDFSLSEFLVTVMPTKDVADIQEQGTKVDDFELKENEEEQKKIKDEEQDNLDIFLDAGQEHIVRHVLLHMQKVLL